MKTNVVGKTSFHQLTDVIESHIYSFLTTCELAKLQSTDLKTYKYMRGSVFLRRVHSITRLFPHFDNFVVKCRMERERRILTQIRDKLVNDVGVLPHFENKMDPHSLTDFNRSIEWLERYGIDDEFIELLLTNDSNGDFWTLEERVYVDIWKNEFLMWCDYKMNSGFVWP